MKKLTPTQQKIYDGAVEKIMETKQFENYEEYLKAGAGFTSSFSSRSHSKEYWMRTKEDMASYKYYEQCFNLMKYEHITLVVGIHGTMKALEKMGLFQIIELDNSRTNIDTVRVLGI